MNATLPTLISTVTLGPVHSWLLGQPYPPKRNFAGDIYKVNAAQTLILTLPVRLSTITLNTPKRNTQTLNALGLTLHTLTLSLTLPCTHEI